MNQSNHIRHERAESDREVVIVFCDDQQLGTIHKVKLHQESFEFVLDDGQVRDENAVLAAHSFEALLQLIRIKFGDLTDVEFFEAPAMTRVFFDRTDIGYLQRSEFTFDFVSMTHLCDSQKIPLRKDSESNKLKRMKKRLTDVLSVNFIAEELKEHANYFQYISKERKEAQERMSQSVDRLAYYLNKEIKKETFKYDADENIHTVIISSMIVNFNIDPSTDEAINITIQKAVQI